MGELFKPYRRHCEATFALVCMLIAGCGTRIEVVNSLKSPDGQWTILEEYNSSSSNFQIILRDSEGKEIAKDAERHVDSHLIDSPWDWDSLLEITNDAAGVAGRPIWRLHAENSKWYVVSALETPVKADEPSTP